jgi:hypothetical protein
MMVVRAGDAPPTAAHQDISAPAASQRSQTPLDISAKAQTFALTADLTVNRTSDGTSPLEIPRPPAVPIDLVSRADDHPQPFQDLGAVEQPAEPEPEIPSHETAVATSTDAGTDEAVSNSNSATANDLGQSKADDSSPHSSHATSRRTSYGFIALALIGIVVGTVAAVVHVSRHKAVIQTAQVQARVAANPQQPSSVMPSNAVPIADEPIEKTTAPEQATAAVAEPTSPEASARPETTRVTLDIKPIDAKVYYLGRQQPGPPFEFDVAKGQRIAVEVARFGFVTRKVVIDDKKPVITCGMVPEHYRPKPPQATHEHTRAPQPEDK